jgi:hypothetical protein
MRGEPAFLGVYAKEGITGDTKRWYAWALPDGKFMLQELERNGQSRQNGSFPGKTSGQNIQRLEPDEFFAEYRVFSASSTKQQPEFPIARLDNQADSAARYEHDGHSRSERSAPGSGGYRGEPGSASSVNAASRQSSSGRTVPGAAAQVPEPGNNPGVVYLWQNGPSRAPDSRYEEPSRPGPAFKRQGQNLSSGNPAGEFSRYGDPYGTSSETGIGADYAARMDFERDVDDEAELGRAELVARVEEKFRTEFSMALVRLKNRRAEALQALDALSRSEGPFSEEHKFMFTDCGLALRKRNLFALAKQFHLKARELSPDDENVLFNLARVMYESGKIDKAREYLCMSIKLSPDFEEGKDFLAFIDGAGVS